MPLDLLDFHRRTNHTYASVRRGHGLDWPNKPWPFKEYVDLPSIPLPAPTRGAPYSGPAGVNRASLAHILYYCAGVTRVRDFNGEPFYFRAYACAGALYPIEVYLVTGDLDSLRAGVYHFHPREFALRPLRDGDHRGHLLAAAGTDPSVADARATLILTGISWRTMWKYEARGYRHLYWDSGMMLANLQEVATEMKMPSGLVLAFADQDVDRLLGLDGRHEVSLALVRLGTGTTVPADSTELPSIDPKVQPLSRREIEYADALAAHDASRLRSTADVQAFRNAPSPSVGAAPGGDRIRLAPATPPAEPVERVILRRGSTRGFLPRPISFQQLSNILAHSVQPAAVNDLYLIANAVDGVPAGAYFLDQHTGELVLLKSGGFRAEAGYLCLEQPLFAQAAAVIFLMADLPAVIRAAGNRGYRSILLEAGIIGGNLYLVAYGLRLGASGSTFYDEEVTDFFSPHAEGKSPMLAIGVGQDPRFADGS